MYIYIYINIYIENIFCLFYCFFGTVYPNKYIFIYIYIMYIYICIYVFVMSVPDGPGQSIFVAKRYSRHWGMSVLKIWKCLLLSRTWLLGLVLAKKMSGSNITQPVLENQCWHPNRFLGKVSQQRRLQLDSHLQDVRFERS